MAQTRNCWHALLYFPVYEGSQFSLIFAGSCTLRHLACALGTTLEQASEEASAQSKETLRNIGQGALKGTNLRGQTEPKRRFSLIFADFCRFLSFPRKQSIWETQIFAENRRFSQKTAENRRNPQIGVCPLRFVPLSAALIGPKSLHLRTRICIAQNLCKTGSLAMCCGESSH